MPKNFTSSQEILQKQRISSEIYDNNTWNRIAIKLPLNGKGINLLQTKNKQKKYGRGGKMVTEGNAGELRIPVLQVIKAHGQKVVPIEQEEHLLTNAE